MAIGNIKNKKIGREFRERVFLGVRADMRRGVSEYRSSGDIASIKRAINKPLESRVRIDKAIADFTLPALEAALGKNNSGDATFDEINDEINDLLGYSQGLVVRQGAGESWDDLATDIETNIENEVSRWIFEVPAYTDIWGE